MPAGDPSILPSVPSVEPQPNASQSASSARSVLVFRIGSLGDTVISVPALHVLRRHFSQARIALLCDYHVGRPYVQAADVIRGSGLVDEFMQYPLVHSSLGRWFRPLRMVRLLASLRLRRFDALVYLVPTMRSPFQIERDRRFFRAAGIPRIYGMEGFPALPPVGTGSPLPMIANEADLLLARLAASGSPTPGPGRGNMDLVLGAQEEREVEAWLATLPSSQGRPWISVSPVFKQPSSRWPEDRYLEVMRALVAEYNVWPVLFGGPGDRATLESLVKACGAGYSAAGVLGVRATAAAMRRCVFHLGNDTGSMHLAAAVGLSCVGVYSSKTVPGMWYPYGSGHHVLRTPIDCEGCELITCVERGMECILSIEPRAVLQACRDVLSRRGFAA